MLAEMPAETLEKLTEKMITAEAQADPVGARKTWGLLPEHQARQGQQAEMQRQDEAALPPEIWAALEAGQVPGAG
jgi:hypothetical protein